jgi:hypothetical protein
MQQILSERDQFLADWCAENRTRVHWPDVCRKIRGQIQKLEASPKKTAIHELEAWRSMLTFAQKEVADETGGRHS